MLRDELLNNLIYGCEEGRNRLFHQFQMPESVKEAFLSSLSSGHHLLILGPPGCGKTALANNISLILDDIEIVEGCPLNCSPQNPSCPWCLDARVQENGHKKQTLPGVGRVKRIQGGGDLVPEDLIGAFDPEAALIHGIHSLQSFMPGKLLRANRGILLVDMIDRMPERVLNTLLFALESGNITIGAYEERIALDILVIATGSQRVLETLPLGVLECFDTIYLNYVEDRTDERQLVVSNLERIYPDKVPVSEVTIDKSIDITRDTRTHSEVERGVSTRGMLRYGELVSSLQEVEYGDEEKIIRAGAYCTLPHRLQLAPYSDNPGKRDQIIEEVLDKALGVLVEEEKISFSKDDMLALVEEIVREDKFRQPLKYGAFDLLLKRIERFPESKLAQLVREMRVRIRELYPERFGGDLITDELLYEIEEVRKRDARIAKLKQEMEAAALKETISYLEREKILERGSTGWELSRRGVTFLLERLSPTVEASYLYGYGKHSTGKKLSTGEGREVGTRRFRFGDRYRDVSFKDTIRETIRNRRQEVTKDDIMVTTKDIRAKIDFILVVDLSGTMRQLEKLWHAKESAIALSLAAAQYGDRVGVIGFSNLADVVVDITGSPQRLSRRVIDLELHENAFTNIGFGILKATQLFGRHRRGRASQQMILISDGDATAPHPSPQRYALRQAIMAAKKGITISCVCINEESTDPELMRRIARIGKGRIYFIGPEGMTTALLEERFTAASS